MNRRSFLRSLAAAPVAAVVPAAAVAAPVVFAGGGRAHGEVMSLINENETLFRGYEVSRLRAALASGRAQLAIKAAFIDDNGGIVPAIVDG